MFMTTTYTEQVLLVAVQSLLYSEELNGVSVCGSGGKNKIIDP